MGQEKHETGEDFLNYQKELYTQLQKRHVTLWTLTVEVTETEFKCSPYARTSPPVYGWEVTLDSMSFPPSGRKQNRS